MSVDLTHKSRKVKNVIRAAGLRDELSFTSLRHGDFAEAADPDLTKSANPLKTLERVKGIEPSSSAWKAVALPLSYTRNWVFIGAAPRRRKQPEGPVALRAVAA